MIRPERVRVEPQGSDGDNRVPGMVEHAVFLGSFRELRVRMLGGSLIKAIVPNDGKPLGFGEGEPLTLHLPQEALRVLAPSIVLTRPPTPRRRRLRMATEATLTQIDRAAHPRADRA